MTKTDRERVERALALVCEAEELVRPGLPYRYMRRQEDLQDTLEKARRILTWFDDALGEPPGARVGEDTP